MKNSLLVHKHLIIRAEAVKPPTAIPEPFKKPRRLTFFDPTCPNKDDFREPFAISLVFLFNILILQFKLCLNHLIRADRYLMRNID